MPGNSHGLAAEQGGHVTRPQLLDAGLDPRTIERWVTNGNLIRVYRGVYAVGHLQSNPVNAAHAAVLAGGERCALAGAPALVLWSVWRHWPKRLEIVTAGARRPSGLIVHHSSTLLGRDIKRVQGLRVTSPARTLLDTATRLRPDQLTRAINDLRLRDLVSIEDLRDVIARNPSHQAVTLLRPHLEYAQPEPTRSVLEDRFLPLLRKHGLPAPQINVHVAGYRVDAYFPKQGLIVELDGWKTHRTKDRFVEDRRQDFAILAATGISTVRLVYEDVSDSVIAQLTAVLRSSSGTNEPVSGPV
ncbi:MAG: type IV toxin-antitoxin system AbiEi family antitoxin domain-containing protein [Solirubrobacteraceae bacterium]